MPETVPQPTPRNRWISLLVAGLAFVLLAVVIRVAAPKELFANLDSTVRTLGPWGPLALGVIYIVLTVLLVPGSVLTLMAGGIYGVALGTAIVSVASTMSVAVAFLLARYALRARVRRWMVDSPRLQAVDDAIGREGWKIVALLRLSPAAPFGIQNYVYGVSSIGFWQCVLTSWIAMLPGTLMYAYLGSLGVDAIADREATAGTWALRIVGLLATIAATVYVSRLARRAMQGKLPETSSSEQLTTHKRPESDI